MGRQPLGWNKLMKAYLEIEDDDDDDDDNDDNVVLTTVGAMFHETSFSCLSSLFTTSDWHCSRIHIFIWHIPGTNKGLCYDKYKGNSV
jgi:hypothetical protein